MKRNEEEEEEENNAVKGITEEGIIEVVGGSDSLVTLL